LKEVIYFLIFISILSSVYAEKVCTENYCNDLVIGKPSFEDTTENYRTVVVMNPGADEVKKGHLFSRAIEAITKFIGGGGGVSTLYYDVIVNVRKSRYGVEDIITYDIIIINKGYMPDRDGKLLTYLEAPDGKRYKEKQYEKELIPPTCPEGSYNRYKDICLLEDGKEVKPMEYIETIQVTPPLNPKLGEWKAVVEYESRVQPPIKAFDSFTLGPIDYTFIVVGGFSCFVIFGRRKKKEEKRKTR